MAIYVLTTVMHASILENAFTAHLFCTGIMTAEGSYTYLGVAKKLFVDVESRESLPGALILSGLRASFLGA